MTDKGERKSGGLLEIVMEKRFVISEWLRRYNAMSELSLSDDIGR